jgi:glycosyltransferase involved in cell wall biosynthesis
MANTSLPVALLLDLGHPGRRAGDWEVRSSTLRAMLRSGAIGSHILKHPSARLLVQDLNGPLPLSAVLATRLLTKGPALIEDRSGATLALSLQSTAGQILAWLRDSRAASRLLATSRSTVESLEQTVALPRPAPPWKTASGMLFLRSDLVSGVMAGGSIAHLSGVLNEFQKKLGVVDLITTDPVPLLDPGIHVDVVKTERHAWTRIELHQLNHNARLFGAAGKIAGNRPGCLLYQRYSLHNWTGVSIARRFGLRFVLEFNGSETWVAQNWGRPLRYSKLAERIEQLNLNAADLVTVVSEPLRAQLLARGIPDDRIFVNPNAVDLRRFEPKIDGSKVRSRYGLEGCCVIGFIGTFGPWHGAENLAEAFTLLLEQRPDLRGQVRLLLIGDGTRLPAVKEILQNCNRLGDAVITGLTPQQDGSSYLAACDILALPTVPNPDGSPFFGSPTKLFEYMAMGRGIAASAIGQITEILQNERTALLVPPADAGRLAHALERLVDDTALRARLGAAARNEAELRHSWGAHVSRLIERIGTAR